MKKALIKNLKEDVYCRIKPSKKHGVGVFAIKDIPKNVNPFLYTNNKCIKSKIINISQDEIKSIPNEVKKMIDDFYHKEDDIYGIPYKGLNANDISFYMNTSSKPNVGFESDDKCSMIIFKSLRKIQKGEELFINYDDF
jgi:SET domain-containing protein